MVTVCAYFCTRVHVRDTVLDNKIHWDNFLISSSSWNASLRFYSSDSKDWDVDFSGVEALFSSMEFR